MHRCSTHFGSHIQSSHFECRSDCKPSLAPLANTTRCSAGEPRKTRDRSARRECESTPDCPCCKPAHTCKDTHAKTHMRVPASITRAHCSVNTSQALCCVRVPSDARNCQWKRGDNVVEPELDDDEMMRRSATCTRMAGLMCVYVGPLATTWCPGS